MSGHKSTLHVRVDDQVKAQAASTLAAMGLSVSDAVRLFLHRVVTEQAFPLELKVPNAQTREAMAEADSIVADRTARFSSASAPKQEQLLESGICHRAHGDHGAHGERIFQRAVSLLTAAPQ